MMITKTERRRYARYDTEAKIYFSVTYDIKTRVKFQIVDQDKGEISPARYSALSKNVSAEGLCFTSAKKLTIGDILNIEVYMPGRNEPICMEGEVRWSSPDSVGQKQTGKFNSGIKLMTVDSFPVAESIYEDEANHVIWSVVLESIFSSFKNFAKEQHRTKKLPQKSAKK